MSRAGFFLVLLGALSIVNKVDAQAIDGLGSEPCSVYVQDRIQDPKMVDAVVMSWVAGFVSADNAFVPDYKFAPFDPGLPGNSFPNQTAFIRAYCIQNPTAPIVEAVVYMLSVTRGNKGIIP